jgi:hypothetical protein
LSKLLSDKTIKALAEEVSSGKSTLTTAFIWV